MQYHVHVYYETPSEKAWALYLRSSIRKLGGTIGKPHDIAVGPHPKPMFTASYDDSIKEVIESMLTDQRNNLSILIHESINDDLRDHTEGARWLGNPLQLNLQYFENQKDTFV